MTFFKYYNHRSKNRGSTLIELLLYMAIFSILTIAIFQLFVSIIDVQLESQSTSSVLIDGQYILNRFNHDIRKSESIIAPAPGAQSAALQLSIANETYTYALIDGDITIASSGAQATDQLNSKDTHITDLTFTHLEDTEDGSNDTITMSFTLTSNIPKQGGPQSETFRTTFGTRPRQ